MYDSNVESSLCLRCRCEYVPYFSLYYHNSDVKTLLQVRSLPIFQPTVLIKSVHTESICTENVVNVIQ